VLTGKQMKDILTSPAATMWNLRYDPNKSAVGGLSYKRPPAGANSAAEMRANKAKVTRQDPKLLIQADVSGNTSLIPPTDNHATYVILSPETEIVISYDFTGCTFALVAGNSGVAVAHIFRGGNPAEIDANAGAQLDNVKRAVACSADERVAVFRTKGLKVPKGATAQSSVIGCFIDNNWTWFSVFVSSGDRIVSVAAITKEMWKGGAAV
jgi:hypothetical protein